MMDNYIILLMVAMLCCGYVDACQRQGRIEPIKVLKDNQLSRQRYTPRIRPEYNIISSRSEEALRSFKPVDWSILICTIPQRKLMFQRLYALLMKQINDLGLRDNIEILFFEDNGQHSIGFKRNILLQASRGEYVNFLDDDDMVHSHYIAMIYEKLSLKPDCISLTGIQTTDGLNPLVFMQSIQYTDRCEQDGIRYLPPQHTNTMKRSIAAQFVFPHVSSGEDTDWAQQIVRSGLLKYEVIIDEPYYFYYYVTFKKDIPPG